MKQNNSVLFVAAGVFVVVVIGVGIWLAAPLFTNRTVDEALPEVVIEDGRLVSPNAEEMAALDEAQMQALEARVQEAALDMPDVLMDDPMLPMDSPEDTMRTAEFAGRDAFHQGSGQAHIITLADDSSVLRFENFEVTNGPDLHVFISDSAEPFNHDALMSGFALDLGPLKGNMGSQNYEIPADVDPAQIKSVVIYCVPFRVVFATAVFS